jgi:hypothetical protein
LKKHRVEAILRQEYREQLNSIQAGQNLNPDNNLAIRNQPSTSNSFPQQIQFLPMPKGDESTSKTYNNSDQVDSKLARMSSGI